MNFKKIVLKLHMILGLASGIVVVFLGITGCILAFQREIESLTKPYQFVQAEKGNFIPPSAVLKIVEKEMPGQHPHGVAYGKRTSAAQVSYYGDDVGYYIIYINPYSGKVLKRVNMDRDFFRIIVNGHFYLFLPPAIGQPIAASATLIFVILMITGIILWWPKNRAARKQRFSIKRNVKWRRRNYDLHNVLGFYMSWVAIFIALTGLVFGFEWFAKAVYWTSSGGKSQVAFTETLSDTTSMIKQYDQSIDILYSQMSKEYVGAEIIEMHYPENEKSAIEVAANPDAGTYWKADYRWFDQYSLKEIDVAHSFGKFKDASVADKISRMNYDLHVGSIGGITTKIIAFFASLIAASLPITGFLMWWGRRKKKNVTIRKADISQVVLNHES